LVVNDPATVRELQELCPAYERALMENDVATLTRLFWSSAHAMRFGVGENLYGMEEIEAFRLARPSAGLERKVTRLDVVTFGKDHGSVTLEFERETGGARVRGRQSQVWVRFEDGWRIVAAHVSLLG
jgi:hypothetical protein